LFAKIDKTPVTAITMMMKDNEEIFHQSMEEVKNVSASDVGE
jgi:hypothetical protein